MKIVAFTGAGISAESGIPTFRDSDGLWEKHKVEDVASPEGWNKDPELVLDFYNKRRSQVKDCEPNKAHELLANLEEDYDVTVVTQNIDDLHERAGSSNVIHLHGEIFKSRSTGNPKLVYPEKGDINIGDLCDEGHQLRPFIVFFGEEPSNMDKALEECLTADILVIIGTSLQVEPAASLPYMAPSGCEIYCINPVDSGHAGRVIWIPMKASEGVEEFVGIVNDNENAWE